MFFNPLRKYLTFFLFFSCVEMLISQKLVDNVFIKSSYDNSPLRNVVVSNISSNTFEYSNENGIALIKYESNLDSIKISAPTFHDVFVSIADIKKNNNTILLFPEEIYLKPLSIELELNSSDKPFVFKPKYRKKYDLGFECSGSIVSLYKHRYKKNKKISSISFYLKNISEYAEVWIVLLFYRVNGQTLESILEHREIAVIDSKTKEVNIPLKHLSLMLEIGKDYMVGFQMIDPSKKHNVLISSIKSSKKTKTFFRTPIDSKWIDISDKGNFSIYFEIYFK